VISLSVMFWLCIPPKTADAHRPTFPDGSNKSMDSAFELDDVDISQAVYQILKENEQVWLSFDPESSDSSKAEIQLGIPLLKETESFRPMVAVLGPELEKVDLPFKIPDGFGAVVYETINKKPIRKFHEPFTDTHSWILIEDIFQISTSGIHYVVIFSQKNESGKFWFATGTKEVFGFSSIPTLTKNISKVKNFHKPSIATSKEISVQDNDPGWKTTLRKMAGIIPVNFYTVSGLIISCLIIILIKKRTNPH